MPTSNLATRETCACDPSVFKGVAIMVVLTIVSIFIGARAFGRAVA